MASSSRTSGGEGVPGDATAAAGQVGGWEYDLLNETAHWTPDVYRLHDLSPDEPVTDWDTAYQRSLACFEPADRPLLQASLERCVGEGQTCDLELPFTSLAGRRLWVRITAQPVWDVQSSRIVKIVGSLSDITPRKQAEAALKRRIEGLQRREHHFRTLVEQMPAIIYLSALDAPGSTLYISPRIETMLGYTAAEWIADPQLFWSSLHPDDVESVRAAYQHQRTTGQPMHREYRQIRRDGRVVWVSEDSTVIFDAHGNPQAVQGAVFDVTQRRRAEDHLRLAHAIVEASHAHTTPASMLAAVAADIQGVTGWESVAVRLQDEHGDMPFVAQVGFPSELSRLVCTRADQVECGICRAVVTGQAEQIPGSITPRGSWRVDDIANFLDRLPEPARIKLGALCARSGYTSVALVPLRQGEKAIGLIHLADHRVRIAPDDDVRLVEDVADHVCTAIQRVQAEAQLRAALAEKEALLREVHHRVKNNFASVTGLVELQRDTLDDERSAGMLTDLSTRIRAMAIVHELLYQSETLRDIDLHEYLHVLVSRLPVIFGGGLSVQFRIQAAGVRVGLDSAIPCGLIVNELVTNALKYAFPDGRPRPGENRCEIAITAEWDGAAYTLTVADNGVGLPAELDWAASKTLGLRLVKMLALHQLHGQMDVERSAGTVFRLRFTPPARRR
jgi:PAS domain S-box-containing protein